MKASGDSDAPSGLTGNPELLPRPDRAKAVATTGETGETGGTETRSGGDDGNAPVASRGGIATLSERGRDNSEEATPSATRRRAFIGWRIQQTINANIKQTPKGTLMPKINDKFTSPPPSITVVLAIPRP